MRSLVVVVVRRERKARRRRRRRRRRKTSLGRRKWSVKPKHKLPEEEQAVEGADSKCHKIKNDEDGRDDGVAGGSQIARAKKAS